MPSAPSKALVDRPASLGYGAALGDLLLRLAVTPETTLDKAVAPAAAPRVGTADDAEEFATEEPAYSLVEPTGGEGLFYAHRPSDDPRDARRFWRSRGIDSSPSLPGERRGWRLLKDIENAQAATDGSDFAHMVVMPDQSIIMAIDDAGDGEVTRYTSVFSTMSGANEDPHTGTEAIVGLVRLGDVAYAACGTDGAATRSAAGTWSDLASAPTADGGVSALWTAKGRLFATVTDGEVLAELDPTDGTPTTLLTLQPGETITDVVDAGSVILASATDGKVYAFVLEDDATLSLAGETKLGDNEYVTTMAAAFGTVVLGTAQTTDQGGLYGRLYVASVNVDTLRDLQLYRLFDQSDATATRAPTSALAYRDSLYVTVPGDGETVVWRFHLATRALTEHFVMGTEGQTVGMAVIGERMFIGMDGVGIFRETETYVSSGYLISSAADFINARLKEWTLLRASGSGVASGATVTIAVTNDTDALLDPTSTLWTTIAGVYSDEQWDALFTLADIISSSRYLAIKVTITPGGANTSTPVCASVTVFASLLPDEVLIRMPVNVSDRVERPNRLPVTVPGLGKVVEQELMDMKGSFQTLELYRYAATYKGVVMNVEPTTPELSDRGSGTLLAMVTFRGRLSDPGAGGAVTGEASLGMGTLGLHTMGL